MYRTVLVPLDGSSLSEVALAHLPQVAGAETDVILLRVTELVAEALPMVPPTTPGGGMGPLTPIPPVRVVTEAATEVAAKAFRDAEEYLAGIAITLRGRVHHARTVVLSDTDPAAVIVDQARAGRADLIVMATHGRSGVVRWVLGSVADKVLHGIATPLLLVRPGEPTS